MKYFWLIFTSLCCAQMALAQVYQKEVKGGNLAYQNKNFADAEVNYKRATTAKPEGVEGFFNLGDALYKQGRFDEALEAYQKAATMATNPQLAAKINHNIGNIYREKKQPKEAAEAYKSALRLNPNDEETRYNLAKTMRELRAQEQQKDPNQKKDQQDQKKDDQKKDEQKKDGSPDKKEPPKNDKSDQQKESDKNEEAKKNEDQKKQEGQGDQPDKQPQPNEKGEQGDAKKMKAEEMKRLVEAAENAERQTRAKVNAQLKKKAKSKTKATEKDW